MHNLHNNRASRAQVRSRPTWRDNRTSLEVFVDHCDDLAKLVAQGKFEVAEAADILAYHAKQRLVAEIGWDRIQRIMALAFTLARAALFRRTAAASRGRR
jgi:hypothetical protein